MHVSLMKNSDHTYHAMPFLPLHPFSMFFQNVGIHDYTLYINYSLALLCFGSASWTFFGVSTSVIWDGFALY